MCFLKIKKEEIKKIETLVRNTDHLLLSASILQQLVIHVCFVCSAQTPS